MRRQQDSNLRGRNPVDFKSTSLTTRTYRRCCREIRIGTYITTLQSGLIIFQNEETKNSVKLQNKTDTVIPGENFYINFKYICFTPI